MEDCTSIRSDSIGIHADKSKNLIQEIQNILIDYVPKYFKQYSHTFNQEAISKNSKTSKNTIDCTESLKKSCCNYSMLSRNSIGQCNDKLTVSFKDSIEYNKLSSTDFNKSYSIINSRQGKQKFTNYDKNTKNTIRNALDYVNLSFIINSRQGKQKFTSRNILN